MYTEVVTERKMAQTVLQQKNEELANFFSVTLDLLCIADHEGRFRRLNAAWARTLGFSNEELMASNFLYLVHPEDKSKTLETMSTLARQKEVVNFVNRFRCKSGSYRWLEWRSAQAGDLIYAAARDITERIEAEEQLKALNSSLERRIADRTVQLRVLAERLSQTEHRERRRIANILHEHFQQLIIGAKMHLGSLRNNLKDRKSIDTVELIDRILVQAVEVSRSLVVELSPPVLYGLGLIPAFHWLARKLKERHGLDVNVYADTDAEPGSDEVQVKSASLRMTVDGSRQIEIVVSDEGVGFDPLDLSKVMPAGRLGLFTVGERIEWLGGKLEIHSIPGQGSRIHVRLPL